MNMKRNQKRRGLAIVLAIAVVGAVGICCAAFAQRAEAETKESGISSAFSYLSMFNDDGSLPTVTLNTAPTSLKPSIYIPPRPTVRSPYRPDVRLPYRPPLFGG